MTMSETLEALAHAKEIRYRAPGARQAVRAWSNGRDGSGQLARRSLPFGLPLRRGQGCGCEDVGSGFAPAAMVSGGVALFERERESGA